MGKTKTAVLVEGQTTENKTSEEKYKEKRERQKKEETEKIHISGLKGGQRVKMVSENTTPNENVSQSEESAKVAKAEKVRGKKYQESKTKIAAGQTYKLLDAIKLVKDTSYSKFDGTMELHLVVKKQGTSASVTLPHSFGKEKKVVVADDEVIKKLQTGKVDFDVLLATPEFMPKLVAFARILGPKGLMPNPKNGTIIKSEKDASKFSASALTIKTEKDAPLIHTSFGKVSMKNEELVKNLETILDKLGGSKVIIRAFIKSTMSPSVKVQI